MIVKSPPIIALPEVTNVAASNPVAVIMLPAADTNPAVVRLPVTVLPVTLKLGKVPILDATTPVNWLPLPIKNGAVTLALTFSGETMLPVRLAPVANK